MAVGSPQSPRRATVWVSSSATSLSRQCVETTSGSAAAADRVTANKKEAAEAANVFRNRIPSIVGTTWTSKACGKRDKMASQFILSSVRRRTFLLAIVAFVTALSLRVSNVRFAELSPVDEIYHLKRMTHFVEFDPDRNAFCPWPPLYDRLFGALAHATGATTRAEVLARVRWFPPIVT